MQFRYDLELIQLYGPRYTKMQLEKRSYILIVARGPKSKIPIRWHPLAIQESVATLFVRRLFISVK